jgi:CPA1 family monovalent cation:H+ antiporter
MHQRAGARQADASRLAHVELRRAALQAARQALIAMRDAEEIGDDAFRGVEQELDWIEMAIGGNE